MFRVLRVFRVFRGSRVWGVGLEGLGCCRVCCTVGWNRLKGLVEESRAMPWASN